MRALKILGIVLATLIVVIVVAAVTVVTFVDPNDYRGDIERLAEQKTGRHLQIGGKLGLKLFPYLAISIADVRLGNPPGYAQSPFVTVRQASVGVRLLPILRKRLEVSRISVDGLNANLVSRSADDNNWKDLTARKGEAAPGAGGGGAPQASIAGVDVTNASLLYHDDTKKSVTALSNLSLHTGRVRGGEPVDMALEFDYGNGGSNPVAHVAIAARAELPENSPRVALHDLDVRGSWFGSAPAAQPLNFSLRSPAVVLDTQAQTLDRAEFTAQAGDLTGKLSVAADKLFTDRVVTGTVMLPQFAARKALASLGVALPATRDPNALSAFSLTGDYRLTPKQAEVTSLDLMLDATRVRGSISVKDLDTMALAYDLSVDRIDVDRYLPPKAASTAGRRPAHAGAPDSDAQQSATPLPIETLRKLNVQGALHVGQATLFGLTFTGMSLPLAAKEGRAHLGPTQAQLLGGTYDGDIVLDAMQSERAAQLSLNEHLRSVDIGELMRIAFDTARLTGHGNADVVATGVGDTDEAILRSLVGKVDFNVKEGALIGVDLSYELRRAQALLWQQPVPERAGPARTLFNTFSGSANLDKGVLHNDDLSIETDYLKTHGKGTLDLGTKAIDYRLVTSVYKMPPAGTSGAGGNTKAADIPLLLTGNLGNLKIRPDLEALAAAKVRQEVNDRLQGKSDDLRKKLGEKLKNLFGH
jgi:AsmA protein